MEIKVDNDKCIGCGACTAQCPDMFEMKDVDGEQKAVVKSTEGSCAQEAADICPVDAIIISE